MSPEWKTQIRIRQAETVLHVDTLSRGRKTVVASINAANKLKISKIDRGFRYVKLGEIALPPGAHVCKFLASDVDNKRVYVIVGISYKELLVYAVELVANPMVTLMATLKTAELSDVAAVTYKRERSLAVITKGVVKVIHKPCFLSLVSYEVVLIVT